MRLEAMQPSPLTASGDVFNVTCSRCGKDCKSNDVDCDLDDKPWTYYCQHCVIMKMLEAENGDTQNG